jgi:hypothetical protein
VTTRTSGFEVPGFRAPNWGHVLVLVVSLQWMIAGGVAIHATRMRENFPDLVKNRPRSLGRVCDRPKLVRALKLLRRRILSARRGCDKHRSRAKQGSNLGRQMGWNIGHHRDNISTRHGFRESP